LYPPFRSDVVRRPESVNGSSHRHFCYHCQELRSIPIPAFTFVLVFMAVASFPLWCCSSCCLQCLVIR
jgi:hypothetical protein